MVFLAMPPDLTLHGVVLQKAIPWVKQKPKNRQRLLRETNFTIHDDMLPSEVDIGSDPASAWASDAHGMGSAGRAEVQSARNQEHLKKKLRPSQSVLRCLLSFCHRSAPRAPNY
jgi:hypothetical protein